MSMNRTVLVSGLGLLSLLISAAAGCVNVKAPEEVTVNGHPQRIDSSHVPPTRDHAEARQRLAEAYQRNRYLEGKVARLERDKEELKHENDRLEDRLDRCEDRHEHRRD